MYILKIEILILVKVARPVSGKYQVIKDKISIDQRPDIINNKERFGDWEIDTIVGAFNKGAIVTLTERTTKMLLRQYGIKIKRL